MGSGLLSEAHARSSHSPTPHARLSPRQVSLLARLADPESLALIELPLEVSELSEVVIAADRHGVMPIVARNLAAAHVTRGSFLGEAAQILDAHNSQLAVAVGQSMLLDHHAKRIVDCFAAHGVVAEIVKGPGFADRLYRDRGDRQYTDIDFLVAPNSLDDANRVMPGVGFHRPQKAWDNSNRDREYKWFLEGNRSILVELHGSLVHSRALRRRIPFGHAELLAARGAGNHVAIADLIVATIHASCGHKFHRLNMLVDV
ncbi:MAG: nucleotidyltransferase family protein, partial [Planctomycetota bacterium]